MTTTVIHPQDIPEFAQAGDVLAFQGKGFVSRAIRLWTWSRISHVGIVYDSHTMVESTQMDGAEGVRHVNTVDLANKYIEQGGRIALLPLSALNRHRLGVKSMRGWLDNAIGRRYDYWQVARLITPFWPQRPNDWSLFCSELVSMAHRAGYLYDVNPSEMTPADVCRLRIYAPAYYQVATGERPEVLEIPRYNSMPVTAYRRRIV